VLSTASPMSEAQPRRPGGGGGGGPVIEYVRGPMRIAAAPVASANPNDAGVARRGRGGSNKKRRWDRPGGGGGGGGGFRGDQPRRFDQPRTFDPNRPGGGPPQGAPAQAANGDVGPGGERRRRRRRRRRRGPNGQPLQADGRPMQSGAPDQPIDSGEPVSFFQPTGPQQGPMLGPDGQPIRKRRRRRRRGRGGRNREWRAQNGGGDGGGTPSSEGGGGEAGGGGGAISDGSTS
jgi:23S rRNA pseudouridine2605 synthase